MNKIAIVGAAGNMGVRYTAVLKYMNTRSYHIDIDTPSATAHDYLDAADGIIIATPTALHADNIRWLACYDKPILCEKPISTSAMVVDSVLSYCKESGVKLQMVNQYRYMTSTKFGRSEEDQLPGDTSYDYFKTGGDGLYWDCISVIALAKGSVEIKNNSPLWRCRINGYELDSRDIDLSYILMIQKWLHDPDSLGGLEYIEHAHKAVRTHIEGCIGTDSDPGKIDFDEASK